MTEQKTPDIAKKITRREFLGILPKVVLGALATGCGAEKPPEQPPEEKVEPEQIVPSGGLRETAVVMKEQGLADSFREKGPFTREIFDQIARLTFVLGSTDLQENLAKPEGTAWIGAVDHEKKTVTFVTAAHVVAPIIYADTEKKISIIDPGGREVLLPARTPNKTVIHPDYFLPEPETGSSGIIIETNDDHDLAVVTFRPENFEPFENVQPPTILPLGQGNFLGTPLEGLAIGYPTAFSWENSMHATGTVGTVRWTKDSSPPLIMEIEFSPHGSSGASGGPLVMMNNGEPAIVGVHLGTEPEKSEYYTFSPLSGLEEMITASQDF